eukprot:2289544-Prymnesium_polylepis.1
MTAPSKPSFWATCTSASGTRPARRAKSGGGRRTPSSAAPRGTPPSRRATSARRSTSDGGSGPARRGWGRCSSAGAFASFGRMRKKVRARPHRAGERAHRTPWGSNLPVRSRRTTSCAAPPLGL